MDQFAPVFALLVGAVVAFGPGSIAITKLVDGVRSFDAGDTWPKGLWIGLSLGLGVLVCVLFQVNLVDALIKQVPAVSTSTVLAGVWGQVVSGLAIGATASYHHERMDKNSMQASEARRAAGLPITN